MLIKEPQKKKKKTSGNLTRMHQYYSYTGFYAFLHRKLKQYLWPLLFVIISLVILNRFVFDVKSYFAFITQDYEANIILLIFFLSESFLGLIPPDIFIAWAEMQRQSYLILLFLGLLSYAGGWISYGLGFLFFKIPAVRLYLTERYAHKLKRARQWGGFLIVAAALLPLPFSPVCVLAGSIGYPFKQFALLTLFRLLRFALYGIAIFSLF